MLRALTRQVFARELLPSVARWWLAAAGMRDWYATLAARLRPHVDGGDGRALIARHVGRMLSRRYAELAAAARLPGAADDARAPALFMAGLYAAPPRAGWILEGLGGAPRDAGERLRALRLAGRLDADARWREVTRHLGELLVALTEALPAELPRASKILGDICFDAGRAYARRIRRALGLAAAPADPAASAIEILRTSEYVFRVNPEHRSGTDAAARTGWLEGSACPWWPLSGWRPGHCGIFGQFQNGVCAELGLKYRLGVTIPKHGGDTCRVELSPLVPLGRRA